MNYLISIFLLIVFGFIFSPWFLGNEIIGGDWPYFYSEMLRDFNSTLSLWSSFGGLFGGVNQNFPLYSYQYGIVYFFVNTFGLPWPLVYKIFWFALFILISLYSIISLIRTVFVKKNYLVIACGIILYICNTYILMIVGGEQMGIALAYSVAPLIVAKCIHLMNNLVLNESEKPKKKISRQSLKSSVLVALIFSFQLVFDIRIVYITIIICGLYGLFYYFLIKRLSVLSIIYHSFIIFFVVLGLHVYWLFPFIYFNLFFLPTGITSTQGFQFFSFADFSHTFSFLHPNWPENIFGKVYFMQPEFLILPLLAYSSLFFVYLKLNVNNSKVLSGLTRGRSGQIKNQKLENNSIGVLFNNKVVIFFVLIGLLGAFLAKGTNPPFGFINEWMFLYIPGMNMFRDPTKFYLLIALSYCILVPFSVYSTYEVLQSKFKIKNFTPFIFLFFTILFLLFLIRPAFMGQLGGTFKSSTVPQEYIELKNFLHGDPYFARTLWIPTQSRFRYQSENHPLVTGDDLFTSSLSAQLAMLKKEKTQEILERFAIKYVIIPYDTTGEIFFEDRKYSAKKREFVEKELDSIPWLSKIQTGKIAVYKTPKHNDHFWIEDGTIKYQKKSNSEYQITISSLKPSTILFSERFHPEWKLLQNDREIESIKTQDGLNSFRVPKGNYTATIFFKPQQYAQYSYFFSLSFLGGIVLFLIKKSIKKR